MYTALKLGKRLREVAESPSALEATVSATLHGLREEALLGLIVAYANSDGTEISSDLAELLLRALGDIHIQGEPTDQQSEAIRRASEELQQSHRKFRAAMKWLCAPKDAKLDAPPSQKLLESGKVKWGRYPLIDRTSESFVRYFEIHGLEHFKNRLSLQEGRLIALPRIVHLVDVFCACILQGSLATQPTEMAIKLCPQCEKFFANQRRDFCSSLCQWKHYWTPERRADDKWVKDLKNFSEKCKPKYGRSAADLQKKLALPNVARRMNSIKGKIDKEDWTGWGKIAERINTIEKFAAK
jgi:hypothetical protein